MPALRLELRPSRRLAGALVLAHGTALVAAWLGLEGWMLYLAAAGILASLAACLARGWGQPSSLELYEDGQALWSGRAGRHRGRLGRTNFVTPALVILEMELEGPGRRWVVLMGDSATPEELRRLRVWLRWRRDRRGTGLNSE